MRAKYTFSHRAGGRYYWKRPAPGFGPAYEEVISCSVLWFWKWTTNDTSLRPCGDGCPQRGKWGATGMMPNDRHILVVTQGRRYLAHVPDCESRGPRIGEEGQPICRRPKGHLGKHRANPEDGWGSNSTWGLPLYDGRYL